jgi:hypothetical protein
MMRAGRASRQPVTGGVVANGDMALQRRQPQWWDSLRDEADLPVDPAIYAPWELLIREAEFALTRGGTWVVHVPSLLLVVWPENRSARQEVVTRYCSAVAAERVAQGELAQRRARATLRVAQMTLGVFRAVEIVASLVPHAIAVEVDSPAGKERTRSWREACLAATSRPATPGR